MVRVMRRFARYNECKRLQHNGVRDTVVQVHLRLPRWVSALIPLSRPLSSVLSAAALKGADKINRMTDQEILADKEGVVPYGVYTAKTPNDVNPVGRARVEALRFRESELPSLRRFATRVGLCEEQTILRTAVMLGLGIPGMADGTPQHRQPLTTVECDALMRAYNRPLRRGPLPSHNKVKRPTGRLNMARLYSRMEKLEKLASVSENEYARQ